MAPQLDTGMRRVVVENIENNTGLSGGNRSGMTTVVAIWLKSSAPPTIVPQAPPALTELAPKQTTNKANIFPRIVRTIAAPPNRNVGFMDESLNA